MTPKKRVYLIDLDFESGLEPALLVDGPLVRRIRTLIIRENFVFLTKLSEDFACKTIYLTNMLNNKDKEPAAEAAMAADLTSPRDAHQANRDFSQEREAQETALANLVAEAVAREMSKAHAQYTTMMMGFCAPTLPTTLKITSGVNGFKVMDPFDWIKDGDIYQHW